METSAKTHTQYREQSTATTKKRPVSRLHSPSAAVAVALHPLTVETSYCLNPGAPSNPWAHAVPTASKVPTPPTPCLRQGQHRGVKATVPYDSSSCLKTPGPIEKIQAIQRVLPQHYKSLQLPRSSRAPIRMSMLRQEGKRC